MGRFGIPRLQFVGPHDAALAVVEDEVKRAGLCARVDVEIQEQVVVAGDPHGALERDARVVDRHGRCPDAIAVDQDLQFGVPEALPPERRFDTVDGTGQGIRRTD